MDTGLRRHDEIKAFLCALCASVVKYFFNKFFFALFASFAAKKCLFVCIFGGNDLFGLLPVFFQFCNTAIFHGFAFYL